MNFCYRVDDEVSLRLLEPRHAGELYELICRNREHLRPWFRWPLSVQTEEDVCAKIVEHLHHLAADGRRMTLIEAHGRGVGLLFLATMDVENKRMELGYWLDEREQGKGLMTRACRAMVRYGFAELGMNRIDITADVDNPASHRVAERLGFTREATMAQWTCFPDGRCRDMANFRLLRRDWEAAR